MKSTPGMLLLSMSLSGLARRIFIIGRRLWPPARMRVSPPPSAFAATASSTECAATKSNRDGNMRPPSWHQTCCQAPYPRGRGLSQRGLGREAEGAAHRDVVVPRVGISRKRSVDREACDALRALPVDDLPDRLVAVQRAQDRKGVGREEEGVPNSVRVGSYCCPRRRCAPRGYERVDKLGRHAR